MLAMVMPGGALARTVNLVGPATFSPTMPATTRTSRAPGVGPPHRSHHLRLLPIADDEWLIRKLEKPARPTARTGEDGT